MEPTTQTKGYRLGSWIPHQSGSYMTDYPTPHSSIEYNHDGEHHLSINSIDLGPLNDSKNRANQCFRLQTHA